MAGSPNYKVYSRSTGKLEYIAGCKYVEDAAALVALNGNGSQIRWGHNRVVWTEGKDGIAADSYDHVAQVVRLHIHQIIQASR